MKLTVTGLLRGKNKDSRNFTVIHGTTPFSKYESDNNEVKGVKAINVYNDAGEDNDTGEDSDPDHSDGYNNDGYNEENTPDVITVYSSDDNDSLEGRVNDLEKRLEYYEIDRDDIITRLTELSDYNAEQDAENGTASEKLDLIIAGLVEIIDNQIEYLDKYDEQQLAQLDFNDLLTEYFSENFDILQGISDNTLAQAALSVSGNTLITDTNNILKTGNEENQQTNKDNLAAYVETSTEHTVYILVFIGIAVGAVFGLILSNHLRKGT